MQHHVEAGVIVKHLGFQLRRRSRRAAIRSSRAVLKAITVEPFVARLAADSKPPAQLADVRVRLARQADEFLSLIPHGDFAPRQHLLPLTRREKCHPCPRTLVTYLPGLYTLREGVAAGPPA